MKEKLDSLIYETFNTISKTLFMVKKDKKIVEKNVEFKDKHKGERCFILGTGPSLKTVDLSLLKNEFVFGLNYLYKGSLVDDLKIDYYCLYDEIFHMSHVEDTREIIEKFPETIFFMRTKAYDNLKEQRLLKPNLYFQACNIFQHGDLIRTDMTKCMTAPYNVVLGCIQTAIYMGFKEIFLLGCDFNSFATLKVEHFYDKPNEKEVPRHMTLGYEMKFYSLVAYHHYALDKYARSQNIHIYNVTDQSLLDAYERKNYLDLF